ncbi:MAG: hypothetical protein QOK43_1169 [Acidimicrobiaceae bacterium]|nr:hypothetical protein [Acidimicrobiaceae bacterium]
MSGVGRGVCPTLGRVLRPPVRRVGGPRATISGHMRARPLVLAVSVLLASSLAFASPGARGAGGAGDGSLLAFGGMAFRGSTEGHPLAAPLVGAAATQDGGGYWLVGADGGVFGYGNAGYFGSPGGTRLARPVVGMAPTPDGGGYWLVASDGGVFAYGNAGYFGSAASVPLTRPIVGMAATPDGGGYWLVASDGGVFAYGNAGYFGSAGGLPLVRPVVGMAAAPDGGGYWLVASDGGIFSYGTADFFGSTGGTQLRSPVVGMAPSGDGRGYWLAAGDGGVFAYGDAPFYGSGVGQVPAGKVVLGMAAPRPRVGGSGASGSSGYVMALGPVAVTTGAFGPSVADLQRRLNDLGYWVPVDGRFGTLTQQAVYALEKAAGLPRAGSVGARERQLLEQGFRPTPRTGFGSVVELDKRRQIIMVVRDGVAAYTFNTSTGSEKPYMSGGRRAVAHTPEGHFAIYTAINGMRTSELGTLWRPRYFTGGYAVHGSPSIPPFPASHGCARVSNSAIDFIWAANLMPIGTPFWVY